MQWLFDKTRYLHNCSPTAHASAGLHHNAGPCKHRSNAWDEYKVTLCLSTVKLQLEDTFSSCGVNLYDLCGRYGRGMTRMQRPGNKPVAKYSSVQGSYLVYLYPSIYKLAFNCLQVLGILACWLSWWLYVAITCQVILTRVRQRCEAVGGWVLYQDYFIPLSPGVSPYD